MIRLALSRQRGLGQKGKHGVLPHLSAAEAFPRSRKRTGSLRASRLEEQPAELLALAGSPAVTEPPAGESPTKVWSFPLPQTPGQPCPWAPRERSDVQRRCGDWNLA